MFLLTDWPSQSEAALLDIQIVYVAVLMAQHTLLMLILFHFFRRTNRFAAGPGRGMVSEFGPQRIAPK